jgi:hypothetical protein
MPSLHNPGRLVRTQHRRRRYTLLVWTLALAVAATALDLAIRLAWLPSSPSLVIGHWSLVISSALTLTTWFALTRRRLDEHRVARDLDAQFRLQARIESAAELASDPSALAAAQRADAARRLSNRPLPRSFAWHAALLALATVLLVLLVESTVFTIRIFDRPPALPPAPPSEDISASIEWRAPESEIKATAIEEISLAASAASRTGFRSLSLEISVNGEPRLSLPLDAETLKTLAQPGTHAVKLPLYLDETSAAEFDIVAYHLRAAPIAPSSTGHSTPRTVTSPLQFIQIRPARDDVERIKTLSGPDRDKLGELAALIGSLKAAQLALLKQNFLLAHAPVAKTEKAWTDANTAVAADQALLSAKSTEARAFAVAGQLPALVVDNLAQVIPIMDEAARLIAETQNEPASRPQGRALGLIAALEKLIRKIILETQGGTPGGKPPPKNPDPFKDDQRYQLPPRADTPAGQLEQLAKDQSAHSNAAASVSDPTPPPPSADAQAGLARRAEELAKNESLSAAARQAAAQAAKDAAAAASQLNQGDASAARAPAQAAAQILHAAAAAQEKAGRDAARADLEAARRALNEAARQPDATARAEKLVAVAGQLLAAAREQQQSGSAEAARQLAAAAREVAQAAVESPPSPAARAAQAAATAQAALSDRTEAAARAARQLQRGSGSPVAGNATDPTPSADIRPAELILGAQLAQAVLNTPESAQAAGAILNPLRIAPDHRHVVMTPEILAAVDHLRLLLAAAISSDNRDETVRRFNPEDLDPAYREAIESYFERLSREATAPR